MLVYIQVWRVKQISRPILKLFFRLKFPYPWQPKKKKIKSNNYEWFIFSGVNGNEIIPVKNRFQISSQRRPIHIHIHQCTVSRSALLRSMYNKRMRSKVMERERWMCNDKHVRREIESTLNSRWWKENMKSKSGKLLLNYCILFPRVEAQYGSIHFFIPSIKKSHGETPWWNSNHVIAFMSPLFYYKSYNA